MSDYVFFLLSTREQQGAANRQDSWGFFKDTGLWTVGCWLARRLHQLKASTTMDLGISNSLLLYVVWP